MAFRCVNVDATRQVARLRSVADVTETERAATLHDVARRVGVSPRTVSRVVNDEGGFSEATRARVSAVIEELHYRPNLIARGLITRRSSTIAFLAPGLNDPFFPEVAGAVQRAADEAGLTMLLAINGHDSGVECDVLDRLAAHAPVGVIVFPAGADGAHLRQHLDRGTRMVVIDAPIDHPNAVNVMSDLTTGASMAVQHLRSRAAGTSRMIASSASATPRFRETGYRAGLTTGATPIIETVEPTFEGGSQAMARLLDDHPEIDGVFGYNDVVAIGALETIRASGRSVPHDVAVVGCDGIDMGAVVTPTLSTIRIDRERLGYTAVETLISLTEGSPTEPCTVVPVELLLRESS